MIKKSIYLSLLVGITAVSVSGTALVLSNNGRVAKLAGATNVSHQISFDKSDSVVLVAPENEKGVEITKDNATKSGYPFVMKIYCYGDGGCNNNLQGSDILYCETQGVSSADPNSYVRVDFEINNIASFTSVILYGTFYTTYHKESWVGSMTVPATYDAVNNKVTGKVQPFKAFVKSIELKYTCAA